MGKIADRYLETDPWVIAEKGFHPEQNRVSESIFSLGNEYMGVRGYFDEGYSGDQLIGSYFNGFYEELPLDMGVHYKGIINSASFMVNTVDWLFTRITLDSENLDLNTVSIRDFKRVMDLKNGTLLREFIWQTKNGKELKVSFLRFISMSEPNLAAQRIVLVPLNFSGMVEVRTGLDFSILHEGQQKNFWKCPIKGDEYGITAILGRTVNLGHFLFSGFGLKIDPFIKTRVIEEEKFIGKEFRAELEKGIPFTMDKIVANIAEKDSNADCGQIWKKSLKTAARQLSDGFENALRKHSEYWKDVWDHLDITIDGDQENQQGIRFCIFQLHQTFHGAYPGSSIGAKGLTGEAYNGHTFWDTETFCLQFYLFNNIKAARNLLEFRYRTLEQAKKRAIELDCKGAFYPIATIDGKEACALWQHASLQLQVSSAVAYGIWHYVKISGDNEFLYNEGIEMLAEISRCSASRMQKGSKSGKYGFFGVMGPDEFHMMVNNNCYLNFMTKKAFDFTLKVISDMKTACPDKLLALEKKIKLTENELALWLEMSGNMSLPQDEVTGVFEQYDGFFDMPHIDIDSIPVTDFPLYDNWSYDRIYRYDMIKQPDVMMFLFLFNQEFKEDIKRANYDYYEPRCIHESSLSPSIHSILASELGYFDQAYEFYRFASRLDLDNYNRNTGQGLHTTSIAAAWMNIVYGFGGMRSDGDKLSFSPVIPAAWNSYSFCVIYNGSTLAVKVGKEEAEFRITSGESETIVIYSKEYIITGSGIKISIPLKYRVQEK